MPVLISDNRNPSKSNILIFFVRKLKKMRMPDLSESNHFITLTASKYQLKYTVLYHLNDSSFQNRHFFKYF